jgi:hypothetical protein
VDFARAVTSQDAHSALANAARRGAIPITAESASVIAIDVGALDNAVAQSGGRLSVDLPVGDRVAHQALPLAFELPGGRSVTLQLESQSRDDALHMTWIGSVAEIANGRWWITTDGQGASGYLDLVTERYFIEPVDPDTGGKHLVVKLDYRELAKARCGATASIRTKSAAPAKTMQVGEGNAKSGNAVVRMIVLWTPAAAAGKWSINALSWNMVASTNDALSLAQVPHSLELQHSAIVPFVESGDPTADSVQLIAAATNPSSTIGAMRLQHGADIVALISDASANSPGLLYRGASHHYRFHGGEPEPVFRQPATVLATDDWAMGDFTFAHELGHVFGAGHSKQDVYDQWPYVLYGHGYWNSPTSWFTLMGAYEWCNNSNPYSCPPTTFRINRWSSVKPGQDYLGLPIGLAGEAEEDRALTDLMPNVAALLPDP